MGGRPFFCQITVVVVKSRVEMLAPSALSAYSFHPDFCVHSDETDRPTGRQRQKILWLYSVLNPKARVFSVTPVSFRRKCS